MIEPILIGMVIGLGIATLVMAIFNIAINNEEVIKAYRPVSFVLIIAMALLLIMGQFITK